MHGGACSTVRIALRTCPAGYVNEVTVCIGLELRKQLQKIRKWNCVSNSKSFGEDSDME